MELHLEQSSVRAAPVTSVTVAGGAPAGLEDFLARWLTALTPLGAQRGPWASLPRRASGSAEHRGTESFLASA